MTDLLQQAFEEASGLPDHEQDRIAAWLIDELRSEGEWDKRFANSQPLLERLAGEALRQHRDGETEPLDPDKL